MRPAATVPNLTPALPRSRETALRLLELIDDIHGSPTLREDIMTMLAYCIERGARFEDCERLAAPFRAAWEARDAAYRRGVWRWSYGRAARPPLRYAFARGRLRWESLRELSRLLLATIPNEPGSARPDTAPRQEETHVA